MATLQGIHGAVAIVLLCSLVFVEEAGVPLPMLPGDLLLITGGVLVAHHAIDGRILIPLLLLCTAGGALVAFVWARALGSRGLVVVARRLNAQALLDRAVHRVRRGGAAGIFACRIIPGLRVNASLVAGASGMELRTFGAGLLPAVALWGSGFIVLGALVGAPAARLIGGAQDALLNAVVLLALGAVTYVGIRRIPSTRRDDALLVPSARWRLAAAMGLDTIVVANLALGVTELIVHASGLGGPDGLFDLEMVCVAVTLAYVVATRVGVGGTAGERLLDVRYTRRSRVRRTP